jgi:hypothetical protein
MRTYDPAATAFALDRNPEDIRNWRRQNFIAGIGQAQGRANVYTFEEACLLRTGAYIGHFLKPYENGFAFARERRALIENAARDALLDPEDFTHDSVLTITLDDRILTGFSGVISAPIAAICFDPDEPPRTGLLQVNISEIARRVADGLKAYVRSQKAA